METDMNEAVATEILYRSDRSPRALLRRDGHPGPSPGNLALVLARAGVGKTALLVGIGLDALLAGQKVLHVALGGTVEHVRDWYDDLLIETLRRDKRLDQLAGLQLQVERRRHIHTFAGQSFSVDRLRRSLEMLGEAMEFTPRLIVLDGAGFAALPVEELAELKRLAAGLGAELWMACRTHREGPQGEPGHLPPPADRFEDQVDVAYRLDPHDAKVRLHVLKDQQRMLDEDLNILLDPRSLLLVTGVR